MFGVVRRFLEEILQSTSTVIYRISPSDDAASSVGIVLANGEERWDDPFSIQLFVGHRNMAAIPIYDIWQTVDIAFEFGEEAEDE